MKPCNCSGSLKYIHKNCLEKWKSQSRNLICPMKCSDSNFTSSNRTLKNLIEKLVFKCKNKCNENKTFTYNEMISHMSNECSLNLVNCQICFNKIQKKVIQNDPPSICQRLEARVVRSKSRNMNGRPRPHL